MAKGMTISSADSPAELSKAHSIAGTALSASGIKIKLKDVPSKVEDSMTKSKKPCNIKLYLDDDTIEITAEAHTVFAELGSYKLENEKDRTKRAGIIKKLQKGGLVDKATAEKALLSIFPPPDPKVVAKMDKEEDEARKELAELTKQHKSIDGVKSFDDATKLPDLMEELESYSKKAHSMEGLEFLDAVKAKMKDDKLIERFIKQGAKDQVNIDAGLRGDIESGKTKMAVAVTAVKMLIQTNELKLVKTRLLNDLKKRMEAEEKLLAGIETMRESLGL